MVDLTVYTARPDSPASGWRIVRREKFYNFYLDAVWIGSLHQECGPLFEEVLALARKAQEAEKSLVPTCSIYVSAELDSTIRDCAAGIVEAMAHSTELTTGVLPGDTFALIAARLRGSKT